MIGMDVLIHSVSESFRRFFGRNTLGVEPTVLKS